MQKLAFTVFQSHRRGSYLHDGDISILSGMLRSRGIDNDIFEVVFHESNEQENDALLDDLANRLAAGDYGHVVISRLWNPEIAWALRRRLEGTDGCNTRLVFMPRKRDVEDTSPYHYINTGSSEEVLEALVRGGVGIDPKTVPGLQYRDESGALKQAPGDPPRSSVHDEKWKLRPNFNRISINPEEGANNPTLVVYGNPGCPYRRSIKETEFWQGVELDAERTNTKGCSFCNINLAEDYKFVKGIATDVAEQIFNIQSSDVDSELVVLLDQDPFPFLPDVFRLLNEAKAKRVHLLIQARADLFLLRKDAFIESLDLAREGGHGLTPFLVGIENFHQPTLDVYNKGVTVEMNIDVLNFLREVGDQYPDVYDPSHVSPGFILWHPWVTFESLRVNVDAIHDFGLSEFRGQVALSKIRLYPDIPFYWRAKSDGLLVESYADIGLDSASRYGYPEEAPYRFQHPEAQVAYTILAVLCGRYEPIHELKLLSLILDWVEAHPEQSLRVNGEPLLAERDPEALVALFEQEHGGTVQSLRKQNKGGGACMSQDLETSLRFLLDPCWEGQGTWQGGFMLAKVTGDETRVQLFFCTEDKYGAVRRDPMSADFRILLEPRSEKPHYKQSVSYNVSYSVPQETPSIRSVVEVICGQIVQRDRGAA